MATDRTYVVIGAGTIGLFYGARLHHAGFDVHFLARGNLAHLRRHGIRIHSPDGDIAISDPPVAGDAAQLPRADVALVAVKATANDALAAILPQVVTPGGTVLVIQNGLGVEAAVAAHANSSVVAGALSFVWATRTDPGTVNHVADTLLELGVFTPGGESQVAQLAQDFARAGVVTRVLPSLELARWRKLTWSIPFGGLCITLDTDTHGIVHDPSRLALVRAITDDVVAAARACGHDVESEYIERNLADTIAVPAYRPTLKQDFDAGRPIELEVMFGNPLRSARAAGYAAPRLADLYGALVERARR